jgi:antitoxin (DNA-binding transcriptional repressor) of toxin-antitoxin stability system
MQTITVEQLQQNANEILGQLSEEPDFIVTTDGKPVAILTKMVGKDIQSSLAALRRARAIAAVADMQRVAAEAGLDRMTPEEIDEEIRAARQGR